MLEIAAEVILDLEVALVDRRNKRQRVHVFEDGAGLVVDDAPGGVAIRQPEDPLPRESLGYLLDGEIELVAGDEIDRLRRT